jgi:hypothetical protein
MKASLEIQHLLKYETETLVNHNSAKLKQSLKQAQTDMNTTMDDMCMLKFENTNLKRTIEVMNMQV